MLRTDSSARRSTRTSPAATSSTARWRSSMRPCRETAKSTRSAFPPPSSTAWSVLSRRTRSQIHAVSSSVKAATAAAPIAIHAAVAAEKLIGGRLTADREDDRVVRRVVAGVGLARDRADLDLYLRRRREVRLREVAEGHGRLVTGVQEAD